jgi:asparagine synthase (glutamine-hydrolysing)
MPGLVGLITSMPREWAEPQLRKTPEPLQHESFYVSGTLIDKSLGVYLGWVARKGSFAESMPLRNENRDVTLMFAGEEFPAPGLTTTLREHGHAFDPDGPAYLVHRFEEEPDFPKGLNGRFHGLLADCRNGKAMLFNDRFGLQRLYFHEAKEAFYFSAEAKAILKVRPELRSTDPRSIGEFVVCGCVLENRTLFPGISLMPPGSAWTFRQGMLEKKSTYFEPREWEEQETLQPEEYYTQLREKFVGSLPRYFGGPEKVGVSLTGGLDTRIIMAWHKAQPNSLPCYTFGSMYRDNQDVVLARKVAAICGQKHEVITTGNEFLSQFAHYAERTVLLTDGCVDLSRSPDLYVNEIARQIAPVRMVGTYGSEVLNQSVMFKAEQPAEGLYQADFMQQIDAAKKTYAAARQVHPVTFVTFRQSPWNHYGVLGLEQTQLAVRTPFLDNALLQTIYRCPGPLSINEEARSRLIQDGSPALAQLRTDRGIGGPKNSIKREFLQFLFKAEYAYDMGMPQWVAQIDHLFAPLHLERLWLGRHKVFHFRVWYRDQLAKYVQETLLDPRALGRGYVSPQGLQAIVKGHVGGTWAGRTIIRRKSIGF